MYALNGVRRLETDHLFRQSSLRDELVCSKQMLVIVLQVMVLVLKHAVAFVTLL